MLFIMSDGKPFQSRGAVANAPVCTNTQDTKTFGYLYGPQVLLPKELSATDIVFSVGRMNRLDSGAKNAGLENARPDFVGSCL